MNYAWIGAMLVLTSCGGTGFTMAAAYCREERSLRQLMVVLNFMECELQYRLTPLPELCREAGKEAGGTVGNVLTALAEELEQQVAPDAASCMRCAIAGQKHLTPCTTQALELLGSSLGRFSMEGQLSSLEVVRCFCREQLDALSANHDDRVRSYQTLGLCAGAALAILFV